MEEAKPVPALAVPPHTPSGVRGGLGAGDGGRGTSACGNASISAPPSQLCLWMRAPPPYVAWWVSTADVRRAYPVRLRLHLEPDVTACPSGGQNVRPVGLLPCQTCAGGVVLAQLHTLARDWPGGCWRKGRRRRGALQERLPVILEPAMRRVTLKIRFSWIVVSHGT